MAGVSHYKFIRMLSYLMFLNLKIKILLMLLFIFMINLGLFYPLLGIYIPSQLRWIIIVIVEVLKYPNSSLFLPTARI